MREDDPDSSAAPQETAEGRRRRRIAEMVAAWPAPTPEQADRLRRLLGTGRRRAAEPSEPEAGPEPEPRAGP